MYSPETFGVMKRPEVGSPDVATKVKTRKLAAIRTTTL
jgi:hypothetical protein